MAAVAADVRRQRARRPAVGRTGGRVGGRIGDGDADRPAATLGVRRKAQGGRRRTGRLRVDASPVKVVMMVLTLGAVLATLSSVVAADRG